MDKARIEIKQIFEADYAKAKKPEAKLELAGTLFDQAETSDSQVARYALLDEARELAMTSDGVHAATRAKTVPEQPSGTSRTKAYNESKRSFNACRS